MRKSRLNRQRRTSCIESLEARLVMSAQPVTMGLTLDLEEMDKEPQSQGTLTDAHQRTGLTQARSEYGFTGRGQTAVVIDTGIGYDHMALGAGYGAGYRVVGGWDFAEGDANPYDDGALGSHGTHVAGIVGSSDALHSGVAPGADLVALRVFDDQGQGNFAWIEQALQWVHQNRNSFANPITTVNMSLGTTWNDASTVPMWSTIEDELSQLRADGIFVSVAAGNSFTQYNTPGLSYPASSPHVVPVASVDDNGNISSFSQRSDRVIAAPGRSIMSTVPDYRGNINGRADDFVAFSGTSMASPYVAGASMLIRQAFAFTGQNNVNEEMIYAVMRNTADMVYDATTGRSYARLNLDRALDSIMPADEYGSSAGAGHNLGAVSQRTNVTGRIARLGDVDFFNFTAGRSGTVTLTASVSGGMTPQWTFGGATRAGSTLTFDVVAGQSYSFGLGNTTGLGSYAIDLQLASNSPTRTNWGTIAQSSFQDQNLGSGQSEFTITASRGGLLTVEAFFQHSAGNVNLEIYDAQGRLVVSSAGTGNSERLDVTVSGGQQLLLRAVGANADVDFRVTNLVSNQAGVLAIHGTTGDDVFSFAAGSAHTVTVNGTLYYQQASSIVFVGNGGNDRATFTGGTGSELVTMLPGAMVMDGAGYRVSGHNIANLEVRGGGGYDWAVLLDSAGDDRIVSRPGDVRHTGSGFSNQLSGFSLFLAAGTTGNDTAEMYDSAGNDFYIGLPGVSWFYGTGFTHIVQGFDRVQATASSGTDHATFYDSSGDDQLSADLRETRMTGTGFSNAALGFDNVRVYAWGGQDTATFYTESGATLQTTSNSGRLSSGSTLIVGDGFRTVRTVTPTVTATPSAPSNTPSSLSAALDHALSDYQQGESTAAADSLTFYAHEEHNFLALDQLFSQWDG